MKTHKVGVRKKRDKIGQGKKHFFNFFFNFFNFFNFFFL